MDPIKIISLVSDNNSLIQQAAQLLVEAFQEHWPDAWPTMQEGSQGSPGNA